MLALIRREQTNHVIIVVGPTNVTNAVTLGPPAVILTYLTWLISGTSRPQHCRKRPIRKNGCDGTCPVEYAQCLHNKAFSTCFLLCESHNLLSIFVVCNFNDLCIKEPLNKKKCH